VWQGALFIVRKFSSFPWLGKMTECTLSLQLRDHVNITPMSFPALASFEQYIQYSSRNILNPAATERYAK
jgi:hypothetical protein